MTREATRPSPVQTAADAMPTDGTDRGGQAGPAPDGTVQGFDEAVLWAALGRAVRAPSMHNSQPWRWRIGARAVELHADPTRRLPRTDPDGRDQVISCGAALHHLLVALADHGQGARVRRLPDPARPHHLATVTPAAEIDGGVDVRLAAEIDRRTTDRRPFRPWPVPAEVTGQLAEIADRQGLESEIVTDPRARRRLYRAIETAAEKQHADAQYVTELADWSGRPDTSQDGVPAGRAPGPAQVPGQMPMRAFTAVGGARQSISTEPESAALLVISSATDTPLQWLRVGEVTSAVLLTATRYGLAASPLLQPLEVGDTRTYVRECVVRTAGHPQMLLRIGWPHPDVTPPRPTPRRPLAEVVDRWT